MFGIGKKKRGAASAAVAVGNSSVASSSAAGGKRLLLVDIVEARGLLAIAKNKTSDPYIALSLTDLGGREIKNEFYKTKTESGTVQPFWDDKCAFGEVYNLDTTDDLPSLTLNVFHRAAYTVSETPMGEINIPLETVDANGGVTDLWFPLLLSGRMKEVRGEVHLKLKFSRPPTAAETSPGGDSDVEAAVGGGGAGEEGGAEGDAEDPENPDFEEQMPNELHVSVIQGRNLIIMDKKLLGRGGTSDPEVRLKIQGHDQKKTKFIRKTLTPVWNEKFVWRGVDDQSLSLSAIVQDHDDFDKVSDKNMGRIAIPLNEFNDKKPIKRWYKLVNKKYEVDGIDRGEIELLIHWKFSAEVAEEKRKAKEKHDAKFTTKLGRGFHSIGVALGTEERSDSDPDDDPDDNEKMENAEREESEEDKLAREEEEKEKRKELSDIEIQNGDYQFQVHIIEARDLKPENLDGTSDPIVYIEVLDQKQNTQVIKQVTSCVFDDLFIFNFRNLDKSQIEDGLIRIAVYDSNLNPLAKNTMIGAYACDVTMVYNMNKDHELYRKWVPLMDDEDPEDVGVQGYLKISMQIIGPGEKLKVHDEDAELAEEIKREAAAGGDIGSLVLATPTIRKEWNYVVATIYRCEGLPVMDAAIGASIAKLQDAHTDAYCKLSFAGGKAIKLKPVTVKGKTRAMINPEFNYQLWYPVSVPTMTQLIRFSVWDKDPEKSELIGNVLEKFNVIDRLPLRGTGIRWYNMYGAPEFKTASIISKIKSGAKDVKNMAEALVTKEIDWGQFYNDVPDKASTYKGRALMKFEIKSKRPPKWDAKPEVQPFRKRVTPLPRKYLPPSREYILRALVVLGTELPSFGTIANQKLRVKVSIGIHEWSSKPAPYDNGFCRWNEELGDGLKLLLPVDPTQMPDIFIYLLKEDLKPVCFTRLDPYKDDAQTELIGFNQPAQWHLLEEDKSINDLAKDVFPGNLLVKLGFGPAQEALSDEVVQHWRSATEHSRSGSAYQVRVHVYQAKDLPAADSNGLCDAKIKLAFMGRKSKTKTHKKNLFPGFYESLVFDNMSIPDSNNFEYACQVALKLYDEDNFDSDDYLGACNFNLSDAVVTTDPDAELPKPKWLKFFREKPGDGFGELLVNVQLIPGIDVPKICRSIVPPTRKAYIELILIGLRDMAPFNFQSMQSPFIEVELNSFGSSYLSCTAPSKRPEASNPNFLSKIIMPVALPEDSIYSTPLQIRARDMRLGGYLKPVVGVSSIDLSHKIPWCADTYRPPATDMFYTEKEDPQADIENEIVPVDPLAKELSALEKELEEQKLKDDYIASAEPVDVDKFIDGRIGEQDTGAGVFGALTHIDITGGSKRKKGMEDAFADPDWTQDDSEAPPAWSIGRKKLDEELEVEFETTPFETYYLTRGQTNGLFGSTLKTVGKLKGLVRVIEDEKEPPLLSKDLMEQLLKPKNYKVRLYCLRGVGLAPMDFDIFGKPAKSDPYLKISLGKDKFNDRENAVDDMTDVDLYKMIEFDAQLPGTSQLKISLMDYDSIGYDDLIGTTTIDLEDRWFDARWQDYGVENMLKPGEDPSDKAKVRWATKPVERRSIYVQNKSAPQGVLECWVDIMKPEVASTFPPDDVTLPPTQKFEVRVVIWKTKNVPPMDSLEGMGDLYIKCWPEGCKPQETDTHWRCKKGKASFNWRMLFDVELGHSTRAMKFPYFHMQLWDRDLLKWNDCAGEGTINLGRYYRKAYKRNVALKLFEQPKGVAAKRAAKRKEKIKRAGKVVDNGIDVPPEEEVPEEEDVEEEEATNPLVEKRGSGDMVLPPRAADEKDSDDDEEGDFEDEDGEDADMTYRDSGIGAIPSAVKKSGELAAKKDPKKKAKAAAAAAGKGATETSAEDAKKEKKPKQLSLWRRVFGPKKTKEEEEEEEREKEEEEALLRADGGGVDDPVAEEKKEEDDGEMIAMINTFKSMTGLWDIDPEDSEWFHLESHDHNTDEVIPMGSICYSIQIWPKDKAVVMPVGHARTEPNTNPYCPPPVGRFRFSWNPFVLGSELCGPVLCAKLFCCIIVLGFLALMIFCQPALNIIINLIFVVC